LNVGKLFETQQDKMFGRVQAQMLLNEQGTTANILQGLSWAGSRATSETYTVVFLAGHGTNRNFKGEFEFMTYDGKVTWQQLQTSLAKVPGKVILILDSCHSGALENTGNMIVFSSSLSHQVSGETADDGFFTQALLEGLSGKADMDGNGIVTLAELDAFMSNRLQQISQGKQHSTTVRPPNMPSTLPLALVNTAVAGNPANPVITPVQPTMPGSSPVVPATFNQPAFNSGGPVGN
jgi:hypothetical protein